MSLRLSIKRIQSLKHLLKFAYKERGKGCKGIKVAPRKVTPYFISKLEKTIIFPNVSESWARKLFLTASLGFTLAVCSSAKNKEKQFFRVVKYGHSQELKRTIEEHDINVNERHLLGWTALHLAAVNGKVDNLKVLLDAGADLDLGDEFINAYRTATDKKISIIDVIVQRESEFIEVLRSQENYLGFTALHYAALVNNLECAKLLLEKGANPNIEACGVLPGDVTKNPQMKELIRVYAEKYAEEQKMREVEERRKFPIEQRLKQHIVGQEGAISIVAAAIRRKQNGWVDDEHPLVFLFLGSSGIGKTELAKQLASYIHKDKSSGFIRVDMSEYQEKHEVAKLIGAPPGYVGHESGGQLTKKLKECPNAVVLLDEVDKAHPDVLTVLLQLFDEGRLTDGKGKTIECKDAIFVMTSNLASDEIADHAFHLREEVKRFSTRPTTEVVEDVTIPRSFKDSVVRPILKRHFRRDEFLGRINEIVYFLPFSNAELNKLVARELKFWATKAQVKHQVNLQWDSGVESILAGGYDHHYGARSIKYEVERRVVSKLAAAQESGLLSPDSTVHLVVEWPSEGSGTAEPTIKVKLKKKGGAHYIDLNTELPLYPVSLF